MRRPGEIVAFVARSAFPGFLFRYNTVSILRVEDPGPPARSVRGMSVRIAGPEDEEALQIVESRPQGYVGRFEDGWTCSLAEVEGDPASLIWADERSVHVSRDNAFRFRVGDRGCWCSFVFVRPEYRGTGVFRAHWAETMRLLGDRGIDRAYVSVTTDNARSLQAHQRIGFRVTHVYRVIRLAGLTRHAVWTEGGADEAPEKGWGIWEGHDPSP